MNDIELREHFEEWAEPLRAAAPPGIAALRRRIRRRRARMAAAAGSALAVTGIVAGLLASGTITGTAGLEPRPATGTHSPAPGVSYSIRLIAGPFETGPYLAPLAAPYFLVNDAFRANSATVIDAVTGNQVFSLHPTVTAATFSALAAAPDGSMFILGQQTLVGARTSFAELRDPGPGAKLRPILPGVTLSAGEGIYGMSVNPADTRLAMNVAPRDGVGPMHLQIYNLTTGALLGNFSEGTGGSVTLQYWPSPDKLAFSYLAGTGTTGNGLRIVDTATAVGPGTSLLSGSTLDPAVRGYALGTFSTDGTVVSSTVQAGKLMVLKQWSAASGQLLHSVAIGTVAANNHSANYCGVLWVSSDGTDLLAQCGAKQLEIMDGQAMPAKLAVTFRASQVGGVDPFAW